MKRIVTLALACAGLSLVGCTTSSPGDIFVDWNGSVQDCPPGSTAVVTSVDLFDGDTIVDLFNCEATEGVVRNLITPGDFELVVDIFGPELIADDAIFDDAFFFGTSDVVVFTAFDLDTFFVPVDFAYGYFNIGWTIDGLVPDIGLCDDPVEPVGDVRVNTDLILDNNTNLLFDETFDCLDGADGVTTSELQLDSYDVSLTAFDPGGAELGTSVPTVETIVNHLQEVILPDFDIQFN